MNGQANSSVVITGIGGMAAQGERIGRWAHPSETNAILGGKNLKHLSEATKLAMAAAGFAAEDARLPEGFGERCGVVVGTSFGNLDSCANFYRSALQDGPAYVNPAAFPNIMMTMTAGQIAIRFGLKALNKTVSTGVTAGLDALCYAKELIEAGRADMMLAGAAESCVDPVFGDCPEQPFSRDESVFFVLEEKTRATARKAVIYGAVTDGYACFCGEAAVGGAALAAETGVSGLMRLCRGLLSTQKGGCFTCAAAAPNTQCTSVVIENLGVIK